MAMMRLPMFLCEIAYALDLVCNPQDPNNLPKVIGDRLTPGDGPQWPFPQYYAAWHRSSQSAAIMRCARAPSARRQCLDRLGNLALGQSSHLRDCPARVSCRSESKTLVV